MRTILIGIMVALGSSAFAGSWSATLDEWVTSSHNYTLESQSVGGKVGSFQISIGGYCSAWGDSTWSGGAPYSTSYNTSLLSARIGVSWSPGYAGENPPETVRIFIKSGFQATAFASTNASSSGADAYAKADGTPAGDLCSAVSETAHTTNHNTQNNTLGPLYGDEYPFDVPLTGVYSGEITLDVGYLSIDITGTATINTFQEAESAATSACYVSIRP